MDVFNPFLALVSIGFGLIGWLAPGYTMKVVDLQPGPTPMGPGEVRAASGALFVGLGAGALILGDPLAYAMIGFAWGGAAIGRLTSLALDGRTTKKWAFFGAETVVAALALLINL
ncbi:DUF4345 family protein [Histidinibacterium lentulum]|uniref:DUF4345 domain-containing protein n=1 Tax=Histidinibacterium lentulum TaxID=2480588 RepID=A0A3N2RA57_9RHOB|nr:DUF4345 family protein [Histidinibacterium lentulum]ROU04295.1 DUF4345 domain-containing protein [Histidinibacterium lentulum]